eukprot:CAMPEP_0183596608 /NCGR_PEP_ID=MMETSP0371-20130417/175453_1 /TAXON_ID=268820 /ORGANISM="Peridinium aciculiferum, Strain PAER-2" /LENGTH=62 /DNA_ID=CAMNT_0025808501 /DNA_START=1 /DNA_END=189 /DNA_ORIENTATION=+
MCRIPQEWLNGASAQTSAKSTWAHGSSDKMAIDRNCEMLLPGCQINESMACLCRAGVRQWAF